jgi:hypothetical protein
MLVHLPRRTLKTVSQLAAVATITVAMKVMIPTILHGAVNAENKDCISGSTCHGHACPALLVCFCHLARIGQSSSISLKYVLAPASSHVDTVHSCVSHSRSIMSKQ